MGMPRVLAVALLSGIDFGFAKYSKPDIFISLFDSKIDGLIPNKFWITSTILLLALRVCHLLITSRIAAQEYVQYWSHLTFHLSTSLST